MEAGKWQVSYGGGNSPRWAPDGSELFFVPPSGELMSAPVTTQPAFAAGTPVSLGRDPLMVDYDVSPDGKGFLAEKLVEEPVEAVPAELDIVLNWGETLRRVVSTN